MNLRWLPALSLVVTLVIACSGGDDADPTPVPTATSAPAGPTLPPFPTRAPQPTATPVATHPLDTQTGVEVIDRALDALASGEAQAVIEQLSFEPYRCDHAPAGTVGSNPCPPGVADGTLVDVIAAGGCQPALIARDRASLATEVQAFVEATAGKGVYAAVEVQEGRLASLLPLRYLVILSGGYSLLLDDDGITHLGTPCEGVGPADLFHPADRAILPPK